MKIEKTKDYDQFKTLTGNRSTKIGHIKRLAESMRENNLLPYQPILVNEGGYIIDGQHRLQAAKMIGIPVHYITVPGVGLPEVQLLNANVKAWSMREYAESHASLGNEHYKRLIEFADNNQFSITPSACMLSAKDTASIQFRGRGVAKNLKLGLFKVENEKTAQEVADKVNALAQYAPNIVRTDRNFISAVCIAIPKIKFDRLLEKASKLPQPAIAYQPNTRSYLLQIDTIYNASLQHRVNLFA